MPGKTATKGLIQDTREGNNPANAVDVVVPEVDSPTLPMAEPPKPKPEETQAESETAFPEMSAPYGLTISDIIKAGTDSGTRALQADRQRTEALIEPQLYDYELFGRNEYPPFLRLDENLPAGAIGQGGVSKTTQRFLNAPTLQDRINQQAETDPAIRSQMPREVDPLQNVTGETGGPAANLIESVLGVPSVINRSLEQTVKSAWGDNWFTRALTWQPGEKWSIAERQQQPLDALGQATIKTLSTDQTTAYGGGALGTAFRVLDLPGNLARAAGLGTVEGIAQMSDTQGAAAAIVGGNVFAPAVAAVTGAIVNWDRTRSYIERAASGEQFTFANKGGESALPWTPVGDGTMLEVAGVKLPFVRSAIGLILDSLTEIPGESLMSAGLGAVTNAADNVVTKAATQIGQPVQAVQQASTAAKQAAAVAQPSPEAALPVANAPYVAPGPITPFKPMEGVNLDWTPGNRGWMEPGYDPDFVARQIATSDTIPSPLSVLASEPMEPLSVPLVTLDNALDPQEIAQVLPDHLLPASPVATKLAEDFVSDNINLATTGHVAQSIRVSLSALEESTRKLIGELDAEQVSRPIDEFGWEQGTVGEQLLLEAGRDIEPEMMRYMFDDVQANTSNYPRPTADTVAQTADVVPTEVVTGPAPTDVVPPSRQGNKLREVARQLRQEEQVTAEAASRITGAAAKMADNQDRLITEVADMVNEDLDNATQADSLADKIEALPPPATAEYEISRAKRIQQHLSLKDNLQGLYERFPAEAQTRMTALAEGQDRYVDVYDMVEEVTGVKFPNEWRFRARDKKVTATAKSRAERIQGRLGIDNAVERYWEILPEDIKKQASDLAESRGKYPGLEDVVEVGLRKKAEPNDGASAFDDIGQMKQADLFVGTKQAIDGTYKNGVTKSGLNEEIGLKGTTVSKARSHAKARPTVMDSTGANDTGVVYKVTTPLTKGFDLGDAARPFGDMFSKELQWVLKQAGATDSQIKTALKAAKKRTPEDFLDYMTGFASRSKLNKEATALRLRKMVDAKLQIMGFDHKVMSSGEKIPLIDVELEPVEKVATHSNAEASFATAQLKKTFGNDADAIAEAIRGAKELRTTYEHRLAELEQQVSQLVEEVGKEEEVLRLQAKADTVRAEQARLAEYQAEDELDSLRDYTLDDTIDPHCI